MDAPLSRAGLPGAYFAYAVGAFFVLATVGVPGLWSAGVGLMLCLLGVLARSGTEFRADRSAYREYGELFGQRAGRWQPLRLVVGVTLKYFSSLSGGDSTPSGRNSWGIWNANPRRTEELVLMLSLENSPTGLILARCPLGAVNATIDAAHELAEFFGGVPVHQFLPPGQFQPLEAGR